jgi:hypothetical protein
MADPIDPKVAIVMNELAQAINIVLNGKDRPNKIGFCLHVFQIGYTEGGRVNYISNCNREDMLTAMKEWLARAEGRFHDTKVMQ